jgi:hypothetical protein
MHFFEPSSRVEIAFSKLQKSEYNTPVRKMKSHTYSNNAGDNSMEVIQIGTIDRRESIDNVEDTPNTMFKHRESILLSDMEYAV